MLRFSASLNFLFSEVSFMERFAAAREAGFSFVEFMFPYDFDQDETQKQLQDNDLKLVLFNLPAGNWAEGDRGIAVDPKRKEEFKAGVAQAVEAANKFNVDRINCLVGIAPENESESVLWDTVAENVGFAAEELGKNNINLMVESVNTPDIPGFYLNTTDKVIKLINELRRPNIYLQYDVYHAEREGEDHDAILKNYFDKIGHIQIADNPGRNQPGTGVVNFGHLLNSIDRLGYNGYIGMEYKPVPDTVSSLNWLEELGLKL